jgi:hypothetical protein
VAAGLDWATVTRLSQGWANPHELALARQLVARLDADAKAAPAGDSGVLYFEVKGQGAEGEALAAAVRPLLEKYEMLGLRTQAGVPARPDGPALACRAELSGARVRVHVGVSNAEGSAWAPAGSFELKVADAKDASERALKTADAIAGGLVARLVKVQLTKGPKVKGQETYRVRIDNATPLILEGLALAGPDEGVKAPPAALAGMSLPPHRSWTVPATAAVVEKLRWKEGVRVVAANLSGL